MNLATQERRYFIGQRIKLPPSLVPKMFIPYICVILRGAKKRPVNDSTLSRVDGKANALVERVKEGVARDFVDSGFLALRRRARDAFQARVRLWVNKHIELSMGESVVRIRVDIVVTSPQVESKEDVLLSSR